MSKAKPKDEVKTRTETVRDCVEVIENLHILHHPLIAHKLSHMRNPQTHSKEFNRLLQEIAMLMTYEVTLDFEPEEFEMKTDFGVAKGRVIHGKKPVLVPIIRAGYVMCEGIAAVTASSKMGHIGLHRDRKNGEVVEYLVHLPPAENRTFLLVDPMMATGETARRAVEIVKENGTREEDIRFVALIVSKPGITYFSNKFPKVRVYAAAVDPELSDDQRIKPGLGYIGERLFGTPSP